MRMLLITAVALCFAVSGIASIGIPDACQSTCEFHPSQSPTVLLVCPQGDTPSLMAQGWWLSFTIVEAYAIPISGIPAVDFWVIDCDPLRDLVLCDGPLSSAADSSTNDQGQTTMSLGTVEVGGCADGLIPVVQGIVLEDAATQCDPYCFPIDFRSPDFDGSLTVTLVDVALFAEHYSGPYDECYDLNMDGVINLVDLALFAPHLMHAC